LNRAAQQAHSENQIRKSVQVHPDSLTREPFQGKSETRILDSQKFAKCPNLSAMSVEQLEQSTLNLPPEDRRRFFDWLCDHEGELIGSADDLDPDVKADVLRRREEALAHPEKLENWESAFPRLTRRFDELRRQNPYSR
jgi:hypothetical protein